jgi:hypothetical protein
MHLPSIIITSPIAIRTITSVIGYEWHFEGALRSEARIAYERSVQARQMQRLDSYLGSIA